MTCIVGLKRPEGIYVGGDKKGSSSFCGEDRKKPKVWIKNNIIFGGCGSYRELQLMQYKLEIPKLYVGQPIDEYLYVNFIDAVKKCFKDNGAENVKDGVTKFYGEFIIGFKGELYCLQNDYGLLEPVDDFVCTGSGGYHSEAVMKYLSKNSELKNMDPREAIQQAIIVASDYVLSVGSAIDIEFLANEVIV